MSQNIDMMEEAFKYSKLGWHVFPVNIEKKPLTPNGFKDATTKRSIIRRWWGKFPTANIGIATGKESGIIVLDVDLKQDSVDFVLNQLIQEKGDFNKNVRARSGGGGLHVYFKHPGKKVKSTTNLFGIKGLDVRGDGGYIIAPPSAHASGRDYVWEAQANPFDVSLDECPDFILTVEESAYTQFHLDLAQPIPEGKRNIALTSIAGMVRSFGLTYDEIIKVLETQNQLRCNPPLSDEELQIIAQNILKYPGYNSKDQNAEDVTDHVLLSFPRTDAGFAEMFMHVYLGKVKFNHTNGAWYIWRKQFWEIDEKQSVIQNQLYVCKLFLDAALRIEEAVLRSAAIKYAHLIQNRARLEAALMIAKSFPAAATIHSEWDADPDIIACLDGTIDLENGDIYHGRANDLIAHYLPVKYDVEASCPRWIKFLGEIFEHDDAVIEFVQRAVGYSLTGRTDEQCMFILIGSGSNGKSTFLEVLHSLFGNYSGAAPFSTFERNRNSTQSNDIAAIAGKRLITSTEPNQGVTFDESRVKSLTGGDSISARFLHQEYFQFRSVAKIWMGVNHLPRVRDDSDGFWRRVRKIDFKVRFWNIADNPPGNALLQDPTLSASLQAELPGILNWALDGASKWYESGLKVPESVTEATQGYRDDSDPLYIFFTQYCTEDQNAVTTIEVLYKAYTVDSQNRGLRHYDILSANRFGERLRTSYVREDSPGGPSVRGIKLNSKGEKLTTIQLTSFIKLRKNLNKS